jgi:hypothetical protein
MSKDYATRSGFKWTVNECLRLEREYDLLKMSVEDIALLHRRTPYAIMYKLDAEGIADFNDLYEDNVCQEEESEAEESEAEESEAEESDAEAEVDAGAESSDNEEFDLYNMKQQVGIISKQLRSLTSVVYKFMMKGSNHNEMAHC